MLNWFIIFVLPYQTWSWPIANAKQSEVSTKLASSIKLPVECESYDIITTEDPGRTVIKTGVVNCSVPTTDSGRALCFSSWLNNSEIGFQIVKKGCWYNHEECYDRSLCEQLTEPVRDVAFCCCEGSLCNRVIDFWEHGAVVVVDGFTTVSLFVQEADRPRLQDVVMLGVLPILVTAVLFAAIFIFRSQRCKSSYCNQHHLLPTADPGHVLMLSPGSVNLDKVSLLELRAHGRFGKVWKACVLDELMAVKIFPLHDKHSWLTEQDIYHLPQMSHENVLRFIDAQHRVDKDEHVELWLLTEFHEHGSLYNHLKGHILNWSEMMKVAVSMTRGLAFLHNELPATNSKIGKPAIAHRDFKSRNVLLKGDMTACIADFGLALKFEPGKPLGETHGLVGTRRYMAPEVLEGAICFNRDSFLRIDMYACGLVLWELVSRCSAADGPVDEYQLPFEAVPEVTQHPSLDNMQMCVVSKKTRPHLYDHWRLHLGLSNVVSTIEESWDHDAEARLSSGCVHERLSSLWLTLNLSGTAGHDQTRFQPVFPSTVPTDAPGRPTRSSDSGMSSSTSCDLPPKDGSCC